MTIKTCSSCKEEKNLREFNKDKNMKDGRQYRCKICTRSSANSSYSKYSDRYGARNRARRSEHQSRIRTIRKQNPCVVCGENDVNCIDFHHIDPTHKEFDLAGAAYSWPALERELSKCVSLCSNCHRKHHGGTLTLDPTLPVVSFTPFPPFPKFTSKPVA